MSITPPNSRDEFLGLVGHLAAESTLEHTLDSVAKENKDLVAELAEYKRDDTVALAASLLTLPEHQGQCARFEQLVALALIHCKGIKVATVADAARWYEALGDSPSAFGEDPAEDVFVSVVGNDRGDHLVLEGIWEGAGFYTQCLVDVVFAMPATARYEPLKRRVQALLRLSNVICKSASLARFQDGGDTFHESLDTGGLDAEILKTRVNFTIKQLKSAEISVADLTEFVLGEAQIPTLGTAALGDGSLERRPLLRTKYGILAAMPTALTVALRHEVIRYVERLGELSQLDQALANVYIRRFDGTRVLGGNADLRLKWQRHGRTHFSVMSSELDVGHHAVFVFMLPSMSQHTAEGFTELLAIDNGTTEFINRAAERVAVDLAKVPGFQRGLLMQVVCGWGAGYAGNFADIEDERWQSQSLSAADFVRLGSLPDMTPLAFWRILNAHGAVHRAGVSILNFNGALNLIGWVRSNDGQLVPQDQLTGSRISPDSPLMLQVPTDLIRAVRSAADSAYDHHRVKDNGGRWHRVLRPSAEDFFPSDRLVRCYASMDDVKRGVITGVYEGSNNFWLTLEASNIQDRNLEYEFWNMARAWLSRVGAGIEALYAKLPSDRSFKVYLCFEDSQDVSRFTKAIERSELESLWRLERISEQQAIRICLADGFLAGFRAADNRAERTIVRALGAAFGSLLRVDKTIDVGAEVEAHCVPNDTARSFHIIEGKSFSDRVPPITSRLLSLEMVEYSAGRVGLGWRAVGSEAPASYSGKEAASGLLTKVVDLLITDIANELATFNRGASLHRLVENIERARAGEHQWHRTAAAVLGLHETDPAKDTVIAQQLGRFAGAALFSRLIAEMAICECPQTGGINPSDMALTKLLARAALLYRIGGLSDAIRFGILPAEVDIAPLGDLLFQDDLGHMVVDPLLSKATNEQFEAHASRYERHYSQLAPEPETSAPAVDPKTLEFLEIFTEEMGFTTVDAFHFAQAAESLGIDRRRAVLEIRKSEILERAIERGMERQAAEAVFQQFALATRPKWSKVPAGCKLSDIYPWRLGRRLSIAARPILQIDDSPDPTVLIAPGLLRRSAEYVIDGAFTGRLSRDFFKTKKMRDRWLGEARDGRGFEETVGRALAVAGWTARVGIGFPEILGRGLSYDPGDVDVLAWRADSNAVLFIECKDLSLTRNYSEVASQLSEYQGEVVDGQADKLKKHLNRVTLARDNAARVATFTSVASPEIVSWMVFSGVSPLHFVKIPALEGTHVGRIDDLERYHAPFQSEIHSP
ncbi:hypothetical protein [Luteimonas fraxinea]|uniref:hypothetical protein n=1 Tax=Luteimonas fraxinea TaxID=2901869 RepID=UPI001E3684A7|nr:hypothetical protein [Luteimonas fraxinea]MCD9127664.1 hypothetical protein [Luteimonas fraxinea]